MSSVHLKNAILARLTPQALGKLSPFLSSVSYEQGRIVVDSGHDIRNAIFPHGGVLSCVVDTMDGTGIETGMIGSDGAYGGLQALDHRKSINKVMVQAPVTASVIDAKHLKFFSSDFPDVRDLLMRYEQFNMAQAQQTAACNALHSVEQRACKWLLRMHDLVGSDLPLTQEFLAQMMGVRRTSVTTIAGALQRAGLIAYRRGKVHIVDVDGLQRNCCECASIVRQSYLSLFGDRPEQANGYSGGSSGAVQ